MKQHQIESPLSSFNNFLNEITNNFENIIFKGKHKSNKFSGIANDIIYDCDKITLLGYLKLGLSNNELHLKITKPLNKNDTIVVNNILGDWDEISLNYYRYIQMYNLIANNYDAIPLHLIEDIITHTNECFKNNSECNNFLVPYKNKISHLYDDDKNYISTLFNRFEYILKLRKVNSTNFEYSIFRVLSSELSEDKTNIKNLKYSEQDLIKKSTLKQSQLNTFINKLFNYGELIQS